jgi:hypothetical protein
VTDRELLDAAIVRYDRAAARVRSTVVDPEHCNDESKEHKDAITELVDAKNMVFRLKNGIESVKAWKERNP